MPNERRGSPVSFPGEMNLDECYGLGTTHDDDHAAAIGAITRENCQRTARRLIRLDSYSEALLSP